MVDDLTGLAFTEGVELFFEDRAVLNAEAEGYIPGFSEDDNAGCPLGLFLLEVHFGPVEGATGPFAVWVMLGEVDTCTTFLTGGEALPL